MGAKKTLKNIGKFTFWVVAAVAVYAAMQAVPNAGYIAGAIWVGFLVREIVKFAVTEVLNEELKVLRQQSYQNTKSIEAIERKVGAILNIALDAKRQSESYR